MKIVSWNCNGALRKKLERLSTFNADVYIVQECEDPSRSDDPIYKHWALNSLWTGNNKNRGLGVFASNNISLEPLHWESAGLEYFLPFTVNAEHTVLAVWTRQANSPTFGYIGQLWKYLQAHQLKLSHDKSIICGDFNSNSCWDVWDRWWNHSDVVRDLTELDIYSLYHRLNNEEQGQETTPTFYMYRKQERPYHIDYAFTSSCLLSSASISVGVASEWLEFSDHMPVLFEVP